MTLLGPSANRALVEDTLVTTDRFIHRAQNWKRSGLYGVQTKKQKAQAKQVAAALHRLQIVLKDLYFGLNVEIPIDNEDLTDWLKKANIHATTPLSKPKQSGEGQRVALEAAARLLKEHGLRLSKKSICRLAALLYGNKNVDLSRQYSKYRQSTNRVRNSPVRT